MYLSAFPYGMLARHGRERPEHLSSNSSKFIYEIFTAFEPVL
jgi:hypothetical protein